MRIRPRADLHAALVAGSFVVLTAALAGALAVLRLLRLPGRGAVSIAYSRIVCSLIGVRIHCRGTPPARRPVMVLANHVSWLDILVITAVAPVVFVAKSEIARWPLIGWVARARGTVFVDRQRRHRTPAVNALIANVLAEGQSIVLFAEGTSSDGNRVLPFRSALVGALRHALAEAGEAGLAVQPLSIAYTGLQGLPLGRQHRRIVAWYGARDLVPHARELLRRGGIDVTLTWGEPIAYDGADRKEVVRMLEQRVRSMTAAALRGRPLLQPQPEAAAAAAPVRLPQPG